MLSSEIYSNITTNAASTATTAAADTTAAAASVATASTTTTNTTSAATTLQVVKTKKRRKRRKRAGHAVTSTTANHSTTSIATPSSTTQGSNPSSPRAPATASGGRKCKAPYFQHDNREYLAKYEGFRLTATAHTWNYAAVARKFKPLRPALASGANKTRRPAVSRRTQHDCACACQQKEPGPEPAAFEPGQRTAELAIQRELPALHSSKINIDGGVLLELLKHSSSSLLETLLLGAGSVVATR